ncbi:antitoxin of toxin-antitoxin stability system [Sphingopyxis sp. MG]|uniref:antitoxin of toxin-antitoxin stability system n=1 Tax=Sphingopyxis sp. MG TaxID=1866325 RepID=UPI000CDF4F7A|nr:antitoxin of toxin-antitoxin stability system [Sphingopyxis sp. MG]AVA14721.1 antitoxin of toxin-antitoxin stability system [Sphingopyxis sp. MG]
MPSIIETTVYCLDELPDAGKEKARAWYRESCLDYDWFDFVYEDFERVCAIVGVRLDTVPVRLFGGGTRRKPCIWFSGFWSQGDGACFEGDYSYARGASAAIRRYAPKDVELQRIADALGAIQRRNFYQLSARITHRGRYYHEYSMAIAVERGSPVVQDMTADADEDVSEALRDLARWLYGRLEDEYKHLTSDEAVDESIRLNEYSFTEDGVRFG